MGQRSRRREILHRIMWKADPAKKVVEELYERLRNQRGQSDSVRMSQWFATTAITASFLGEWEWGIRYQGARKERRTWESSGGVENNK